MGDASTLVRHGMGSASVAGAPLGEGRTCEILHRVGNSGADVIILFHPRSTSPRSRRFPLAMLALAAVLEGHEEYAIVDGNIDPNPVGTISGLTASHRVELLAVSVMPGPQMVAAMETCREIRTRFPRVPI